MKGVMKGREKEKEWEREKRSEEEEWGRTIVILASTS